MAEDLPGFTPLDRRSAAMHDRHFADDYVDAGGDIQISRTLAGILRVNLSARRDPPPAPAPLPEDDGPGAQGFTRE
jgi:hypothetical protein